MTSSYPIFNPNRLSKADQVQLFIYKRESDASFSRKWDYTIYLIRSKCWEGGKSKIVRGMMRLGAHDDYESKFVCVNVEFDDGVKTKLLIYKPTVYLVGYFGSDFWHFCKCFVRSTLHNIDSNLGKFSLDFELNYEKFPSFVGRRQLRGKVRSLQNCGSSNIKEALDTTIVMFCEPTRLNKFRGDLRKAMSDGSLYPIDDSIIKLFQNYKKLCKVFVLGFEMKVPWEKIKSSCNCIGKLKLESLIACREMIGILIPVKLNIDESMEKQKDTNKKDGKGEGGRGLGGGRRWEGGSGSGGGGRGGERGESKGRGERGRKKRSVSCLGCCMAVTATPRIFSRMEFDLIAPHDASIDTDCYGHEDRNVSPSQPMWCKVLLCCDHKDYVWAHILCTELSPRAFDIGPSREKMKPKEGYAVVKEASADIPLLPNLKCIHHDFIICEDILNPSVPLALRLSGILTGGVVIVYERKIKILYDDVNCLLVEIKSAWKVKSAVEPPLLPKGKNRPSGAHFLFEAVTPENHNANDLNDVEQTIDSSNKFPSSATFHQSSFFAMRLDTIDELSESVREKEPNEGFHQADPANITLDDPFDSYQADTSIFNRFERFDIEGDEETQINFPSQRGTDIPPAPAPPETRPQKDDDIKNFPTEDDIPGQHVGDEANISFPQPREDSQQPDLPDQPQQHLHKQKTVRRKVRQPPFIMDMGQTLIPSNMYQTWLQDSVDILAKRPTIIEHVKEKSSVKLAQRVDLPPVALSCGLVVRYQEVHYPQPLLDLLMTCMQPLQDSPSGRTTSPHPPEPSSSSPTHGQGYQDPPNIPVGGFGNGFTSERLASEERIRTDLETGTKVPITEFNIVNNNGMGTNAEPYASAGNSGTSVRSFSVPSPVLGPNLSNTSYSYPGRYKRHNDCFVICRCYKCIYEIPPVREDPEQWILILRNICWYLALVSHVPMQSSIMNSTLEDKHHFEILKIKKALADSDNCPRVNLRNAV